MKLFIDDIKGLAIVFAISGVFYLLLRMWG